MRAPCVTLRGPAGGLYDVSWWWDEPREGRKLAFRDPAHARAFARRLGERAGNTIALRRLVALRLSGPPSRMEDAEVLEQIASWLAAGQLRVVQLLEATLTTFWERAEEPPPSAPRHVRTEAPEPAPEIVETPTFPVDLDVPAVVAAHKKAAVIGSPFCEECMKKQAAAQAALADLDDMSEVQEEELIEAEGATPTWQFDEPPIEPAAPLLVPPRFPVDPEAAANAGVLRAAAQSGAPLCEPCAKAG